MPLPKSTPRGTLRCKATTLRTGGTDRRTTRHHGKEARRPRWRHPGLDTLRRGPGHRLPTCGRSTIINEQVISRVREMGWSSSLDLSSSIECLCNQSGGTGDCSGRANCRCVCRTDTLCEEQHLARCFPSSLLQWFVCITSLALIQQWPQGGRRSLMIVRPTQRPCMDDSSTLSLARCI